VKWNDEGLADFMGPQRQAPERRGELPDGEYLYRDYMVITYCCRQDAFYTKGMNLPIGKVPLLNVLFPNNVTGKNIVVYNKENAFVTFSVMYLVKKLRIYKVK